MERAKRATLGAAGAVILSMLASLAAPTPQGSDWLTFHAYFAITLGTAVAFIGASALFIMGLGGFTAKLKRVYALICLALSLLGLAFLQLPLILYLVPLSSYWKDASVTAIGFVLALALVYMGARAFAKLFGVRSITTNIFFALGVAVALAALVVVSPHTPTATPEIKLDGAIGMNMVSVTAIGLAAIMLLQAKRIASVMYTNALAWMIFSFTIVALGGLSDVSAILAIGDDHWFLIGVFPMIPLFIGGLLMLRAAYSFNAVTVTANDTQGWVARDFFGKPIHPKAETEITSVQIVVYAADLASRLQDINALLDPLRQVTAKLKPGEAPSRADEKILMNVYMNLEKYLLEREPVRKFTKQSLRQTIAQKLRLTDTQPTFWGQLT